MQQWLGSNTNDCKSIVLTPQEHQVFTNAWRQMVPYSNSGQVLNTNTVTLQQIKDKNGEARVIKKTAIRFDRNKLKQVLEKNESIDKIKCD